VHVAPLGRRGVRLIEAPVFSDPRGSLTVTDSDALPFVPARMFTVYAVPSEQVRGEHAHRRCEQVLTCLHGSVRVLWDDGDQRGEVVLDRPQRSLYLPARVWGAQHSFSDDAALLVLASLPYDSADYVRSYDEFVAEFGGGT
jgi:UDP-2-acetamido-3-amino-2,3-dideoxy-glucuronate N-acetyltransferase